MPEAKIQTILRREAYPDPYEALKGLTRNQIEKINPNNLFPDLLTLWKLRRRSNPN